MHGQGYEMTEQEQMVLETLEQLKIAYKRLEHPPVFRVEDAARLCPFEEQGCKNLFLKDKRLDRYYLVVMMEDKRANMKAISKQIGSSGLTFGKEEALMERLGLYPGAVTPFGLLNNVAKDVIVLLDKDLAGCDQISFHPNVNTATLILAYEDFVRFLVWQGNPCRQIDL